MVDEEYLNFDELFGFENPWILLENVDKVNIFFLTFVKESEDALQNLWRVLQAEHLGKFDEIETFDARRTMIFFKQSVSVENIVLERLHVHPIQRDQSVGSQNVNI